MSSAARCRAVGGAANCTREDCPEGVGRRILAVEAATIKVAAAGVEQAFAALDAKTQVTVAKYLASLEARSALVREDVKALGATMGSDVELEDVRAIVHHRLLPVVGWLYLSVDSDTKASVNGLRKSIDEYMRQLTSLLVEPPAIR
jgi:hypothetical protein